MKPKGRYEGDGAVTITETGYDLEFAYPQEEIKRRLR